MLPHHRGSLPGKLSAPEPRAGLHANRRGGAFSRRRRHRVVRCRSGVRGPRRGRRCPVAGGDHAVPGPLDQIEQLQAAFLGPGESRAARAAGRHQGFGDDPAGAGCGARPGRVAGGLHGGRRWRGTAVVGGVRPAGAHRSSWRLGSRDEAGLPWRFHQPARYRLTPVGPRSEQDVLAFGVTVWSAAPGSRVAHPAGRLAVDADLEPHQRRDRGVERVVSPVVVDEDWILRVEE